MIASSWNDLFEEHRKYNIDNGAGEGNDSKQYLLSPRSQEIIAFVSASPSPMRRAKVVE